MLLLIGDTWDILGHEARESVFVGKISDFPPYQLFWQVSKNLMFAFSLVPFQSEMFSLKYKTFYVDL